MNIAKADFRRLLFVLVTLPLWAGCDGCRRTDADNQDESAKKAAPVDSFTFGPSVPLPTSDASPFTAIKPGHWFTLRQSIRSNKNDERGELKFDALVTESSASANAQSKVSMTCTRPAVLPKGRMKRLDIRLLPIDTNMTTGRKFSTRGAFLSDSSFFESGRVDHAIMRGDEYFFVILTKRPERFASFAVADWVRPPMDADATVTPTPNYRIVFPRSNGLLALPETIMDWTSTAVLFWDDVSPSELTTEQRRALTDWLHFGGRMIVNGESNVSELAASELASLLPIQFDGMTSLDTDSIKELIQSWSVAGDDSKVAVTALTAEQASRISLGGPLAEKAEPIANTDGLLARKSFGRGEVVMSRFDLTSDWLIGWRSRESFFNAAVLARPARKYDVESDVLIQRYVGATTSATAKNSTLRFASRDLRLLESDLIKSDMNEAVEENPALPPSEFVAHPLTGFGAWRNDSDVAIRLQSILRENAGIIIPPIPFVMRSLLIYLTLLVPANYIVFRLLGRLEWAWLAIPVLAIGGAAWIARSVSLDLGLARNHSEVTLIELQAGHPRAHLTRFGSIYNSLSSNYQLQFDGPDTAVAAVDALNQGQLGVSASVLRYGYSEGPALDNFSVPSNRTRMFHAEQMVDVGGTIELLDDSLRNGTTLDIGNAVAIRKLDSGTVEVARIGSLNAKARVRVRWEEPSSTLTEDPVLQPFMTTSLVPNGSARLVGTVSESIGGMAIVPETPLQSSTNVLLANLISPPLTRSTGDMNLIPKRKKQNTLLIEEVIDEDKETKAP